MVGNVQLDIGDKIATVTLDNPDKRNAVDPHMAALGINAVKKIEDHGDIRTLIVTGTGESAFSSGFDMSYYSKDAPSHDDIEEAEFSDFVKKIKYYEYPTIAMINGGTYGGSMHLIASCDLRVAVNDANFGITPAKIGLVYGGEDIYEVMAQVGPANVKEFLFTGEFVDADRAYEMGFLNDVVSRDELENRTMELAEAISSNAPLSLRGMKHIIRALLDHGALTEAEKEWALRLRQEAKESEDHAEGVEAFMQNRKPTFEGN